MTEVVPLLPVSSQVLTVTLDGQSCRIEVFARTFGMFVNVFVADVAVALGVQARDRVPIVRAGYSGFRGDLMFVDTQGSDDPVAASLGGRHFLAFGV